MAKTKRATVSREFLPDDEVLMKPREVCAVLGVSPAVLRRMRSKGSGPEPMRTFGRNVMYRTNDVESFVDAHPEGVAVRARRRSRDCTAA